MKNAKVLSALGLMSLASTAALAASGPTLGSVLDASGVKVSGNMAVSLRQNVSVRGTTDQARSNFQVDQGLLSIAYQPKEGFGGVVDLATGQEVAQGGQVGVSTAGVVLSQAYLQYKSGDLTLIGGRYYTAAGYEVFPAAGNLFVTRSQTYQLESTYHTGVRASYAVSNSLSVFGGLNNGVFAGSAFAKKTVDPTKATAPTSCVALNQVNSPTSVDVTGNNCDAYASTLKNRGVELGTTWSPVSGLSLALTAYHGKVLVSDDSTQPSVVSVNDSISQNLYSFTASYNISKDLTVAVNIDQGNALADDSIVNVKYNAYAGYVTYALSNATTLGLRLEEISKRGVNNNTGAVAAVLSHSFAKNFDLRTELSDVDPETGDDRQVKLAVQGVLKF